LALIRCPECGKEVSNRAPACPHCGYPMDASDSGRTLVAAGKRELAVDIGRSRGRAQRWVPWLMAAGSGAIVVGSFLPWVEATIPLIGTVTVSGLDGDPVGDGLFALVGGLALVLFTFEIVINASLKRLWPPLLVTLGVLGIAAYHFVNLGDAAVDVNSSEFAFASRGPGIWFVLVGAGAVLIGVLAEAGARPPA